MTGGIVLLRSLLLAGAGVGLFLVPASAQNAALHIPAQPLGAALTDLARQTGRGVLFTPDSVEGIRTVALDCNCAAEQAVQYLIAGTSLEVVSDASGNLVVRQRLEAKTAKPSPEPVQAISNEAIEIVRVVATRQSADAMQFQSRAALNVLSAADLDHTAVHNVAEALQLLPGINVTNTGNSFFGGIDGASRGEGMFAQVRGMNSEFTLNMINGVDVAQGMPYSREVQLSLLPPSGLQTIVVAKTAQADMQSDFIGGAVDFRTPTAFDSAEDQHFSITLGGRAETRAMDYGESGLGGLVAFDAAKKFGATGQFGVYVSGYFDNRQFANSEVGALMELTGDNAWAFAISDAAGHNPAGLSPERNLQSTGFNIGISNGYTARYGATASVVWNLDEATQLYGRMTYAYAHTEQNSTLSQILGTDIKTGQDGIAIGTSGLYQTMIGSVSTRLWYETNPEKADLGTAQIGGETKLSGGFVVSGNIFYSWGNNDRPNHIEISARPASDFAYGGASLLRYGADNFPVPILSMDMSSRLADVGSNLARRGGQLTIQHSGQDKMGAVADVEYVRGDGLIKAIKLGAKYETSWRSTDSTDYTNAIFNDGTLFSSLGLYSSYWASVYPGRYNWSVPKINQAALFKLFYSRVTASSSDSCALPALLGICNTQTGREAVVSGYTMATLALGDVELMPGLRFEHTEIKNLYWQDSFDKSDTWIGGGFSTNRTRYNELLPSVFLNWRPSDNSVYRASVWTSYTRPAFVQLANGATVTRTDSLTSITMGNPDLKPIRALNFDASAQWNNDRGGYVQASAFAKALSNYLYNSGSDYVNASTAASSSDLVHVTKPENGGDGHVAGLEFEFRQKLAMLNGWLSGFGVGGNYTLTWTQVDLGSHTQLHHARLQNAPDSMANFQLFYERDGLQFDVLWHYSGAYVSRYDVLSQNASWDDVWIRPMQRVDLHTGFAFGDGIRVDASVSNLLGNITYWSHVGEHSLAISDIVDTGRTMLFTVKYAP